MEPQQSMGDFVFHEKRSAIVKQAIIAAMLGLFLFWGVEFSNVPAIHNGAHDSRHSMGFPCH